MTRRTTPVGLEATAFELNVRTNVPGLYETTVAPTLKYDPSTITSPGLSDASEVFTAALAPEKLQVGWFDVAVPPVSVTLEVHVSFTATASPNAASEEGGLGNRSEEHTSELQSQSN